MKKASSSRAPALSRIYSFLIYLLLYLPIFIMILFSFNESKSMTNFTGFSLRWYRELFSSGKAFEALKYSLIIVSSAPILMAYPWVKRFFMKGVMLGALKG